jgi:hypothetical protein
MSGSQTLQYSTSAFTDAERTDIRRYMGFPAYGPGPSGFQSWRFFTAYGLLEFRMTNAAPSEIQVVRYYLANLYVLEAAIPAAGANLDTDVAAVWTHNKDEVKDRTRLYNAWRRRLCGFWGLPPGPDLGIGGSNLSLVV